MILYLIDMIGEIITILNFIIIIFYVVLYNLQTKKKEMHMKEELEARFKSYPMTDENKIKSHRLRNSTTILAESIDIYCPESREKSIALTKLEECLFWCNAALSRNP